MNLNAKGLIDQVNLILTMNFGLPMMEDMVRTNVSQVNKLHLSEESKRQNVSTEKSSKELFIDKHVLVENLTMNVTSVMLRLSKVLVKSQKLLMENKQLAAKANHNQIFLLIKFINVTTLASTQSVKVTEKFLVIDALEESILIPQSTHVLTQE